MVVTAYDTVAKFAPVADEAYVAAFQDSQHLMTAAGITTPLRLAHFMAQALHETAALTLKVESGRYGAMALGRMWDSGNWHRYFADRVACVAMADKCKMDGGIALFSLVYGNRMGNGPPASRDGWTFRGRGLLQITGRAAYSRYGQRCGVTFEKEPDLVASAEHALKPALADWTEKKCNTAADHDDIELVTRLVNGGAVGLEARRAWFARLWPFVTGARPVERSSTWKVQVALDRRGYECGVPDGVLGPRTRAAILAYRAAERLALSPTISPDLLRSLGSG